MIKHGEATVSAECTTESVARCARFKSVAVRLQVRFTF